MIDMSLHRSCATQINLSRKSWHRVPILDDKSGVQQATYHPVVDTNVLIFAAFLGIFESKIECLLQAMIRKH